MGRKARGQQAPSFIRPLRCLWILSYLVLVILPCLSWQQAPRGDSRSLVGRFPSGNRMGSPAVVVVSSRSRGCRGLGFRALGRRQLRWFSLCTSGGDRSQPIKIRYDAVNKTADRSAVPPHGLRGSPPSSICGPISNSNRSVSPPRETVGGSR